MAEVLSENEDEPGEGPALSALCQSFLGQPNPYPDPAPNVDQIVGDTVVPVGSQAGCSAAQNETTVAVDPSNPAHIVAGANDYRLFNTRRLFRQHRVQPQHAARRRDGQRDRRQRLQ
jgi:hypothetical protein